MTVTPELVDRLALLSRLSLSSEEKQRMVHDLQRMIGFVEKLQELDLQEVEPLTHLSESTNPLSGKRNNAIISRDSALNLAADKDDKYYLVPKVIRKP